MSADFVAKQRLPALAPPSKNKTAAAISRGGCLKTSYKRTVNSLIDSPLLEASA
jgi:hypothetical protein